MTATLPQALREPLGDTGLTYRQISHWCKRGWLHPVGEGGSGNPLEWPAREVAVARRMAELIADGFRVDVAARRARDEVAS